MFWVDIVWELYSLFTPAWITILINLLIIDIVMSGDNAILIGMATKDLKWAERTKAISIWILLATVLRIVFSFFAVFLLSVFGIKLAWGLLLMYVVWKFYKEIRVWGSHHDDLKVKATFLWAIYMIVVADVSMSLDNVLAVAGASHGNVVALWIWLVISIILMAFASNLIAKYLNEYPQIQWVGLMAILVVAMGMVYDGSMDINGHISQFNILPFVVFIVGSVFVVLQQKYIPPLAEDSLRKWIGNNYMTIISSFLLLILVMMFFWDSIKAFMFSHLAIFYTVLFAMLFVILEVFTLVKVHQKKWLMEKLFFKK